MEIASGAGTSGIVAWNCPGTLGGTGEEIVCRSTGSPGGIEEKLQGSISSQTSIFL